MSEGSDVQAWSRGRLLAILGVAAAVALLLLVGLGLAIYQALSSSGEETQATTQQAVTTTALPESGTERRAVIAAQPMLSADSSSALEGTPSTTPAEIIEIPALTDVGPAQVPSGVPHTPEGAAAQLAAIDKAVLEGMSIPQTHEVYQDWSQEGAGEAQDWVMTQNVQAFLTSAGASGQSKDDLTTVTVTPAAAQIKGTDGQDWVLACVLLDVTAVIRQSEQIAYGHCEAMAWVDGRWVIAAGPTPAPAPSTWPGTDLAEEAGWLTWATTAD
ncbi:hypothetical protein [Ornithinimicrobium sp. INDO-MA30-4]|uniref:hypothetical protein n=1 Tax=Ornithinimicrobium sp. INDO-MA30-4 TaxID=2908651 RepID=UPI001F35C2B5|nr:hypothetical protein [Ornithinimicrobium sp. INDO-MA30-4]UJH71754.1 hypothetical protein L0A91_16860 [Ornithinimicrobium sp. INDO-MA30-4]